MTYTMLKLPSIRRYAEIEEDIAKKFSYAVVQFLQLPYPNIGDYVCVPHSWIPIRRAANNKSIVAYPNEPSAITKIRVMKGEKPPEQCKLYIAIILFETYSYETANEFIRKISLKASTKRDLAIMNTDCKITRATAKKRLSPLLKRTKLPGLHSKRNAKKVKVKSKARSNHTISNSSKSSEYPIFKTRTLSLSELQKGASPGDVVMQETQCREKQAQISHDALQSCDDDLLLRYLQLQRKPDKDIKNQIPSKTLYVSKNPLILLNQLCNESKESQENLFSNHRNHLHDIELDNRSNVSSVIQNIINKANQLGQQEIPELLPINQNHVEFLPIPTSPGQSSEVEPAISKSSYRSKIRSALNSSVTYSNSAEHQDSIIEEVAADTLSEASCIEQNGFPECKLESESSGNPNSLKNANHSGQSVKSSVEEELPVVDEATSSDVSATQDVDDDEQMNSSEMNSEEMFDLSQIFDEEGNQSVDSILSKKEKLLKFIQKMEVDSLRSCKTAHDLHQSLVQSYGVIKCIVNASENFRKAKKGKVIKHTSKEVTMEVQQMSEENQAKTKEKEIPDVNLEKTRKKNNDGDSDRNQNDDDNIDNVRNKKVRKTTGGNIRTFVLPPEYDPDDTRWTLKYRENDPELNLVELVPQSNVFIDSIKLAHCKRVAKDSKVLARLLLVEIFSQSALSVCSLTGVRATAFDPSGTNVRPGLDENARMAILSFVEKYALEKRTGAFDTYAITNTLRSKIQEIRAKYDKERKVDSK